MQRLWNSRYWAAALIAALVVGNGDDSLAQQPPLVPEPAMGHVLAPKAFRAAMNRVLPSMVTIESFGGVTGAGSKRGQMQGIRLPGEGPTTGIVVSPDGYIVTSTFNFLKKPPIITVVLPSGERKVAKLLGQDLTRKLCVLKVDGVQGLPVPEFAPRSQLRVGQWAVALGVGFGDDEPSLSAGIISATSRIQGRAVQTDANLSPANYGGPLVDIEGRVIGVCVPLSPQSKEVASGVEWYDSGIGFAVPLDGAQDLLTRLKAGETLKPGFLGIRHQAPADKQPGSIITDVLKGSPAEQAGLKKDDRIVVVDGEDVLDHVHLMVLVGKHIAGDEVKLGIKRGDETLELQPKLGEPPPPAPAKKPVVNKDKPADGKDKEGEGDSDKSPEKPKEGDAPSEKPAEEKPSDEKPAQEQPEESPPSASA